MCGNKQSISNSKGVQQQQQDHEIRHTIAPGRLQTCGLTSSTVTIQNTKMTKRPGQCILITRLNLGRENVASLDPVVYPCVDHFASDLE